MSGLTACVRRAVIGANQAKPLLDIPGPELPRSQTQTECERMPLLANQRPALGPVVSELALGEQFKTLTRRSRSKTETGLELPRSQTPADSDKWGGAHGAYIRSGIFLSIWKFIEIWAEVPPLLYHPYDEVVDMGRYKESKLSMQGE